VAKAVGFASVPSFTAAFSERQGIRQANSCEPAAPPVPPGLGESRPSPKLKQGDSGCRQATEWRKRIRLAGELGFEPRLAESESGTRR
jgi:hypothetical protein